MKPVFLYDPKLTKPELLDMFEGFVLTTKPVAQCDLLIRWGSFKGDDQTSGVILNRKQPLKNALDKAMIFEILRLNKVRRPYFVTPQPDTPYPLIGKYFDGTGGRTREVIVTDLAQASESDADFFVETVNTIKKYNIYIFDLQVFYITKKTAVRTNSGSTGRVTRWEYESIPPDLDQDAQKVGRLAKRCLHVLGLDFGLVHAGIDVRGRPVVLDVNPVPDLPDTAAKILHRQLLNYMDVLRMEQAAELNQQSQAGGSEVQKVLLGADPEFMLRDTATGDIIYPSDYLNMEGTLGYDERSENREGILYPLAEVRPEPDFCPLKLTEKIGGILAQAMAVFPKNIEWLAGSLHFEQYQIGGHIHFSNININSRLLRALDNYLGIPVMLIEDPARAWRRRKQYGWLGSFRSKPHGGFEYRTPGSWLVTPELTRACLCLAKIVATHYTVLTRDYFADPEVQKAFYLSKKHYFYDVFDELWADIKASPLYHIYARALEPLTAVVRAAGHWDENTDLRKSWGLI